MLRTASDELPSLVLIKQSTATPRTSDEENIRAEDLIILKRQIQQAEHVSRETLLYAREVIRDTIDLMIRKGYESNDSFLKYHLHVAVDEFALLIKSFDLLSPDQESPCFARVLSSQTAMVVNRFPARFSPNIRTPARLCFVPSQSSEAIFSHALRYLLHAAAQCKTPNKLINVWLDQREDVVMLHLDNIRVSDEQDFLLHVSYPRRIKTLLSALHARLKCSRQGVTVYIPVEV